MTYPDGRHAERPIGTAQPYVQERQPWPADDDRPPWAEEPVRPQWTDRPGPSGWLPEPAPPADVAGTEQPTRGPSPDHRGWNAETSRRRWLDEPDRRGGRPVEEDPWFPRQPPPADAPPPTDTPTDDWALPGDWGSPEQREAPFQPASFTAGEEAGLPALLRGRALDRLVAVNASHASHAADKVRTKDDLCEHAIALFSFDLTDKTFPLSTATRLSLSDDGNSNLVEMLSSLATVAEYKVSQAVEHGHRWDPRIPLTGLVNRSEDLPPSLVYLGIGVSTLDTPEMAWRSRKGSVDRFSGLHLRGQGYLYLDDGTAAQFVRAAQLGAQSGEHEVEANTMLLSHHAWKRRPDLLENADQRTKLIWERIRRLHRALKTATGL